MLKFTPLEFETRFLAKIPPAALKLKFTPLEFETPEASDSSGRRQRVKIYSVGV